MHIWIEKIIIAYVKAKGSNLNTLTSVLKFVMKCETLSLEESFQGTYFGHCFPKVCQYANTNEKVYRGLKYVFTKST
jgi:hypothetical protein